MSVKEPEYDGYDSESGATLYTVEHIFSKTELYWTTQMSETLRRKDENKFEW